MPKYNKRTMCNDCPFRKKSPKGWLGPHTPQDMQDISHSDNKFICHKSVNRMSGVGIDDDTIAEEGEHCVGLLRYRNKICKTSHDQEQYDRQQELKDIPDQDVLDAFTVKDHHTI